MFKNYKITEIQYIVRVEPAQQFKREHLMFERWLKQPTCNLRQKNFSSFVCIRRPVTARANGTIYCIGNNKYLKIINSQPKFNSKWYNNMFSCFSNVRGG